MNKIDAGIVADMLALCEEHAHQDQGTEERTAATVETVEWIAELIGNRIKRDHPRFNLGEWTLRATPRKVADWRARVSA